MAQFLLHTLQLYSISDTSILLLHASSHHDFTRIANASALIDCRTFPPFSAISFQES